MIYSTPRFGPNLGQSFGKNPIEIIDDLSTRNPETIELNGVGPIVSLQKKNDQLFLERGRYWDESLPFCKYSKEVLLTFDDGPDPVFTPKILEILEKEDVPAVFFVVGEQLFRHPHLAREIVKRGHQIGNHSFSHISEEIDLYAKQNVVDFELDFSQKIIQAQTGYKTKLFRVPYSGTEDTISLNNLVLSIMVLDRGYQILSSTTDSFDWRDTEKEKVVSNAVNLESDQVILLHDGGGNREVTVAALPEIIRRYKEAGYQFKTADAFLKDGEMALVPASFFEKAISQIVFILFWLKTNFFTLINLLFRLSIGMMMVSIIIILNLATFHITRNSKKRKNQSQSFVSVLVPAYNEEKTIEETIESLLASDYSDFSDFEIIVINNNSTDKTVEKVRRFTNGRVRLINEKKQGKFAALNRGIKNARGEILVMIDADTQVLPNTISELVYFFQDNQIGAVAGNIKVGNINNPLTAFQAIEYLAGLQLDRRAYGVLGAIPVVPGALGAWRKKVVMAVGGYKNDTLTEDAELTIRIQKKGYKVVFNAEAVAYTEAPQTLQAFLHQRLRWTLGTLQVLFKYKDIYFKRKFGALGMIALPYQALIQLPLMLLTPIIDLLAIIFFFFVSPEDILRYFLVFLIFNFTLISLSFLFAKEARVWLLALIPIQRFIYQGLWYYILYRSVLIALKGTFVPWLKTIHFGTVTIEEPKESIVLAPGVLQSTK